MKETEKIVTSGNTEFIAARSTAARSSEHSLEQVAVINEVVYINDSRSTDIKLTCSSINSVNADIVLITGGRDRNTDYSFLLDTDVSKLKAIIYLGEEMDRMLHLFSKLNMLLARAESMEEGLKIARKFASKNQVVLFSPSCPSHDIFDNYKNRGNKFRNLILEMTK